MTVKTDLEALLEGEVSDDAATLAVHSRDASLFVVPPALVVYPRHAQDLHELAWYASVNPELSLTARSAGTDMTGGPLTTSIVVNFTRYWNRIIHHTAASVTVQPGVYYRDLESYLSARNLLLPSYPASKDLCTVGGMVANNAGGEKSLIYGKTDRYVKQLKVILDDGKEYLFKPLDPAELKEKLKQKNREGKLYREMYDLITVHQSVLQAAKPRVSKNSAGYALWDVWNGNSFDLTKLLTGSQGTLGLITEITFSLVRPRAHSAMLVIFLRDLHPLAAIIERILSYHPETFESYDHHTLRLALKYLPEMIRRMKAKNLFTLLRSLLPEFTLLLTGGLPRLILLAQFSAASPAAARSQAQAARASLESFHVASRLTLSPTEMSKYQTIRRESFNLLRKHIRGKRTAPFIDDIVVPPRFLPEFLPQLEELLKKYDFIYTIAGHVGDGNFHIIPLIDPARPDFPDMISELEEKVYSLVLRYHGTISGEHNDGLIRSHYLKKMFGEQIYDLFVQTKNIFDPKNIFNPGKKVGAVWENAKSYLAKN